MIFRLTDELTNILTRNLQIWFGEHPLAQEYRWNQNPQVSKIGIYDQFPDVERRFPSITVKGMVGNAEPSGLHDGAGSLLTADGTLVGEAFAGWYNPRAEFQVESTYDADARRVSDLLIVALIRTLFYSVPRDTNGDVMWQLPDLVRVTGRGTRTDTNNRLIYYVALSSSFKVAWHDEKELPDTFLTAKRTVTILDC